jgi:hypothetical protein
MRIFLLLTFVAFLNLTTCQLGKTETAIVPKSTPEAVKNTLPEVSSPEIKKTAGENVSFNEDNTETFSETTECETEGWVNDTDPKGLNVRDSASSNGKVIARLVAGEEDEAVTVTVTGGSGKWLKISGAVKIDGQQLFEGNGWVFAQMISTSTKGSPGYKSPAPLFSSLSKSSTKTASVPSSSEVKLLGCKEGWVKVVYKNQEGWLAPENQCGSPVTNCN